MVLIICQECCCDDKLVLSGVMITHWNGFSVVIEADLDRRIIMLACDRLITYSKISAGGQALLKGEE